MHEFYVQREPLHGTSMQTQRCSSPANFSGEEGGTPPAGAPLARLVSARHSRRLALGRGHAPFPTCKFARVPSLTVEAFLKIGEKSPMNIARTSSHRFTLVKKLC
jgi:hypothetical protein